MNKKKLFFSSIIIFVIISVGIILSIKDNKIGFEKSRIPSAIQESKYKSCNELVLPILRTFEKGPDFNASDIEIDELFDEFYKYMLNPRFDHKHFDILKSAIIRKIKESLRQGKNIRQYFASFHEHQHYSVDEADMLNDQLLRYYQNDTKIKEYTVNKKNFIRDNPGGGGSVEVIINGKNRFFRRLEYHARYQIAAIKLRRLFSFKHFINYKIVRLNNNLGIFTKKIRGKVIAKKLSKSTTPKSLSDARAFEFLVGNTDANTNNFFIKKNKLKTIVVFDYDKAFSNKVLFYGEDDLGNYLPKKYTKSFVSNLYQLTNKFIKKNLLETNLLTEDETQALILRRDVLINDIEYRGPKVTFP